MSYRSILFAGLPSTGKTTYLALITVAAQTGADEVVQLLEHRGDFEYINHISRALESCREAEHTEVGESGEFDLVLGIEGNAARVRIPDISGETWEEALDQRQWTPAFDDTVSTSDGLVLFVRADDIDMGATILEVLQGAAALGEGPPDKETSSHSQPADAAPTNPPSDGNAADARPLEDSPEARHRVRRRASQVDVVDLLQIVALRNVNRPLRLSIVLSAWDTVRGATPHDWLTTTFPLVRQYLKNSGAWQWTVFGVSAQGGDFRDEEVKGGLIEQSVVERATVVGPDATDASVFSPLLWALEPD